MLDVALRSVTAHALAWPADSHGPDSIVRDEIGGASRFRLHVGERVEPVAQPRARTARVHAAKIGADTGAVLDELGIRG